MMQEHEGKLFYKNYLAQNLRVLKIIPKKLKKDILPMINKRYMDKLCLLETYMFLVKQIDV
jgi:hypothetical protein